MIPKCSDEMFDDTEDPQVLLFRMIILGGISAEWSTPHKAGLFGLPEHRLGLEPSPAAIRSPGLVQINE
jgi:hypothetical protein